VAVLARHLFTQQAAFGEQGQAGAHGALRIILAYFVGAEDGQQAIAGVLQHLAVMGFDDAGATRECAIHHGVDFLRIDVLAQMVEPTTSRNRMVTCLRV
jgi:hypothetical protein